jgi:ABC-type dipeptide/oligopeptide/nickel transport system permease component
VIKNYFLRRTLLLIPILFAVITIVFAFLRLIPGDPVEAMLGESARAADVAAMRKELLLDQPLLKQYFHYLGGVFRGDLGNSWNTRVPVASAIMTRLPATLELAVGGMTIAILIAFPLGILAAKSVNRWPDRIAMVMAVAASAIPHFWLAPLLILLFSIYLGWFPVSGTGTPLHAILPSLTLGLALAAILVRMIRSSMLEELQSDYIRTARAKGTSERAILWKHALPNALLPVLTILGLQFGSLLTGAIITETIFSWPGIGRLLIQAIYSRDYPLVQGCILIFAVLYAFVNLLVDILYGALDPRIQFK